MKEEQGAHALWQEVSMTTFFLLVCGFSVVFFLVFLWQCGKPRRPAKNHDHVLPSPEMVSANSPTGRRRLAHLESQMADFLGSHQHTALFLLLAFVLISMAQHAQAPPLRAEQGSEVQHFCETVQQLSSTVACLADARGIA
jgi:hypothetical protein